MIVKIKKKKGTKKCVIKRKLKFENNKNCLEATQLDNKNKFYIINEIYKYKKNKINVESHKNDHKE